MSTVHYTALSGRKQLPESVFIYEFSAQSSDAEYLMAACGGWT